VCSRYPVGNGSSPLQVRVCSRYPVGRESSSIKKQINSCHPRGNVGSLLQCTNFSRIQAAIKENCIIE
ncbi:hypothetical protein, partial [Vibrio splendidus]|uniref:hypothetical protein n=1 Tax=Vibrio splendidus TaxID=29497 RepID=UPI001A7E1A9A